jgi:hypothetical protein
VSLQFLDDPAAGILQTQSRFLRDRRRHAKLSMMPSAASSRSVTVASLHAAPFEYYWARVQSYTESKGVTANGGDEEGYQA